jgi:hypothetical protein
MNENLPCDSLDNLLRDWADERAVSSENLDNLQGRIVLALVADEATTIESAATASIEVADRPTNGTSVSHPEFPATFHSQSVSTKRASVTGFLVGATLSALVAFVWFAQSAGVEDSPSSLAGGAQSALPDYAQLNDDQLRGQTVLLSEMKELFGDQLTWLAETDERIEVGLSDRQNTGGDSTSGDTAVPLAMRVVVEKRASATHAWELAWTVDVVSKSEEVVDLAPETADGTSMRLWAYAMPDGMFAVDSELAFSNNELSGATESPARGEIFRAAFSNVQHDRLPSEELLTGSDGLEYRVLQTVAVLDKKVG